MALNYSLAATWARHAADQGDVSAQGVLGCFYHEGKGVEQDDALAVAWWEKGAVGNDLTSKYNLGQGYMRGGFGLTKNAHCAKIYIVAAAAQGHANEGYRRPEAPPRVRGMRHPRRPPHVPGLPLRDGHQHGPILQPRLPGSAQEGPQARLRPLPVPPLQVIKAAPRERPAAATHCTDAHLTHFVVMH